MKRCDEMKKIIIILDGWGDSHAVLKKTKTPNIDKIALLGTRTYMYPIKGIAPESGASQFAILGQPLNKYPGRGPTEALGAGIHLKKDEIAVRCNFAKVSKHKITDIRAKIPSCSVIAKLNKINKNIKIVPTVDYRAVMIVKGVNPDHVRNTHPGYIEYKNFSIARHFELKFIEKRTGIPGIDSFIMQAEKIMKNKTLLLRGAGSAVKINKKMKNWVFIGDMPIEHGLAKMLGMSVTHRPKTLKAEIQQVVKQKKNIYLQIKGPDSAGHEGNCRSKIKEIEKIDKALKPLINIVEKQEAIVCITSDHATPCKAKVHTSEAVPFIIAPFCNRLPLRIEGKDVMKLLSSK